MKSHSSIGSARAFVMLLTVAAVAVVSNQPIFNDFVSGQQDTSVCARSAGIREAIVAAVIESGVSGVDGCEDVTNTHLAAITGIPDTTLDRNRLRTAPKSFDLEGLTSLSSLSLSNHYLGTLPSGFFADTTAMTSLHLQVAKLTSLPANVFDHLSELMTLNLYRNMFRTFPDGLTTVNETNHPDLVTLTLGLDFRFPGSHFEELPSD